MLLPKAEKDVLRDEVGRDIIASHQSGGAMKILPALFVLLVFTLFISASAQTRPDESCNS